MQIVAALIEALRQRGVRRVYGVPGDYVLGLFAALQASPIDLICTAGEEGAGFAADAHGRLQGLGVAVVTYGVGALKLLNPVAGAYAERSPLLVISGAPGLRESEEHPLLHHRIRADQTQLRLFREVTVASAVLDSGRTAAEELVRVLETMRRESRPGYLELPADCLQREIAWPIDLAPPAPARLAIPDGLRHQGERWLAWMRSRQRPVVLGGVELARFRLEPLLRQILEREGWPLATSLSGKTLLPESLPQVLGIYEGAMGQPELRQRVESSDGLLVLGQPLNDLDTGVFTMALDPAHVLQVDLEGGLRTAEERNENLDPLTLLRLWAEAPGPDPAPPPPPPPAAEAMRPPFAPDSRQPVGVERLMAAIEAALPGEVTVLADPGDALFAAADLRLSQDSHFLASSFWASLGFALPAAIGAWGACPERPPVVLLGDGALLMCVNELATLARYAIPALVIVLDNGGYGTERPILDGPFNDVQPVAHRELALAMGFSAAERMENEEQLWRCLVRWRDEQRTGPTLISVSIPTGAMSGALRRLSTALAARVKSPSAPD
jgi:TPP-dependent 2-oxoacid decarboxylase